MRSSAPGRSWNRNRLIWIPRMIAATTKKIPQSPLTSIGMTWSAWVGDFQHTNQPPLMNIQPGKHQVLVRHFQPMATFSFVAMATPVWEFGIFSMNQGLIDGGRAGLIWGTVIHAIGFIPIILSMAEMASIAPTSGSQFHWVSEFSHPRWQKILSYYTGWISTMAWQAGNAVGVFLTGTLIQTIILENNKDYAFPFWHGSLLVMSNIVFTVAANILLTRYIPKVQRPSLCCTYWHSLPSWSRYA